MLYRTWDSIEVQMVYEDHMFCVGYLLYTCGVHVVVLLNLDF